MARRSECFYSSFREFDRRRKFIAKMVYSPPLDSKANVVAEQINCQALTVLGDGTVMVVQLLEPINKVPDPRLSIDGTYSTRSQELEVEPIEEPTASTKKEIARSEEILMVNGYSSEEEEDNDDETNVLQGDGSSWESQVDEVVETKEEEMMTTQMAQPVTSTVVTMEETATATTVQYVQPQSLMPKKAGKSLETKWQLQNTSSLEMIDYDCATLKVVGSDATPKYLINEADTLDGKMLFEDVGPFAITFLPANVSNNLQLSVILITLEEGQYFHGFFVKCGARNLMQDGSDPNEDSDEQIQLGGYRSTPVDFCNFTGAAAKQSDLKPKVEQILLLDLPKSFEKRDIVITCWATVVVDADDYWIISSSLPMMRNSRTPFQFIEPELMTTSEPVVPPIANIVEVVDCSAMALFDIDNNSSDKNRILHSEQLQFDLSSTLVKVPNGTLTGTLVFGEDLSKHMVAYMFGCMSASTSFSTNYNFGILHERTLPGDESDHMQTLATWCGENYRQHNQYFVKSTKKVHFAWHLPQFVDSTTACCRAVLLLENGTYALKQSDFIEIVHPQPEIDAERIKEMLPGFPVSFTCDHIIDVLLDPHRFRDCLECSSKMAALEFVEGQVKVGGNITVGIVSADSDFVMTDYAFACYVESTGKPIGRLVEVAIGDNLMPKSDTIIEPSPVECRQGVIRNRDVGPVYEVFFTWQLPSDISWKSRQLRCSAVFPSLPSEQLVVVDSLPLRRVGSNFQVPIFPIGQPQSDVERVENQQQQQQWETTTSPTTTGSLMTTLMSFRILPHLQWPNGHAMSNDFDLQSPITRFKYDCFAFKPVAINAGQPVDVSPFWLDVSSKEFEDGQSLRITLHAPFERPFRGFMILCAHVFGNSFSGDSPAGRLVEQVEDRVHSAAGGCGSRVETSAKQLKTSVIFLWKAPLYSEFPVQCRAVVVEGDDPVYWTAYGPMMFRVSTHQLPELTIGPDNDDNDKPVLLTKSAKSLPTVEAMSSKRIVYLTMDPLKTTLARDDFELPTTATAATTVGTTEEPFEATYPPTTMASISKLEATRNVEEFETTSKEPGMVVVPTEAGSKEAMHSQEIFLLSSGSGSGSGFEELVEEVIAVVEKEEKEERDFVEPRPVVMAKRVLNDVEETMVQLKQSDELESEELITDSSTSTSSSNLSTESMSGDYELYEYNGGTSSGDDSGEKLMAVGEC